MLDPDRPERPLAPGTVTRLVAQQKNPQRVSVFLDGTFAFGVYQDLVVAHGLRKGLSLSVADQEALLREDAAFVARATALNFLSHRARTRREVRDKLVRGGTPEEAVDETLDWLSARGYLDDASYAVGYAQSRARGRGYGPERVKVELLRRGVERELIEAALNQTFEPDDVTESAREHARKRLPALQREPDARKRRKKLFDFLVRRGFAYDVASRVVEEVLEDEADEGGANFSE